jgi:polyisoprenoid-binding protein YceI
MKKSTTPLLFTVLMLVSAAFTFLPVDHYVVSTGYKMEFKSSDPSGSFSKMGGDIYFSDADLVNSKFNLNIEVSSINTGNGMQNKKAQTSEWFNSASFPQIKFKSSKIVKNGNGYLISGDLTMKGTTKQYTIPATKTTTGNKIVFSGTFNVDRLAFNVGKKSNVVPDKMKVVYVIPALKK